MRRGHKKSKGLNAQQKSKKVDFVTKEVIEACGDRIGAFKRHHGDIPPSDDEIWAAFPDCTDKTLDALLNIGSYISGENSIFSTETLKEEAKQLTLNIIREGYDSDFDQAARIHVEHLLTRLFNYSKQYDVYVPIHGITLNKEIDRVKFGDVLLVRMDESFFRSLAKQTDSETLKVELQEALKTVNEAEQAEKLEYELTARVEEAEESLRRSIVYEKALDAFGQDISALEHDLREIEAAIQASRKVAKKYDEDLYDVRGTLSIVLDEIREAEESVEDLLELDQTDGKEHELVQLESELAQLERDEAELERIEEEHMADTVEEEDKRKELKEAFERKLASKKRIKQLQAEARRFKLNEMRARRFKLTDLEAQLAHVKAIKGESPHTLRARIDQLKSEVASAEKSQMLINRFKDSLCLQYCYTAEWQKAKQFADKDAASVIDLLRYAVSVADVSSENVHFGRQGEIVRDVPTLFSIETGTTDFQEMPSNSNGHPPLEITLKHLEAMKGAGIFEMAALLAKTPEELNPLEGIIMRGIHWYSLSQIQPDRGSELLSLVIVLETLLSPEEREPIAATISECVAMLLEDSPELRYARKEQIKQIYKVRSKVVHGKLAHDEVDDGDLEYLRDTCKKLISRVWDLYVANKLKGNEQRHLIQLINKTKLGAPPIR